MGKVGGGGGLGAIMKRRFADLPHFSRISLK